MKYFSSLATTLIVVLSSVLLVGCDKNNDDPYELPNKLRGVYRVEISITGDIEGYKPTIQVFPNYPVPLNIETPLYDEHGKEIVSPDTYTFNYEKNPTPFSKTMSCYTSNKATGMTVWLASNNRLAYLNPHPIKVSFKGYFNNKLIKEQVKEIDGLHPLNGLGIDVIFRMGENAMGIVEE